METSGLRRERLGGFQQRLVRAKAGPVPRGYDISVKMHFAGRDAVKQSEKLSWFKEEWKEKKTHGVFGGKNPQGPHACSASLFPQ